jgi:hypothetical protein
MIVVPLVLMGSVRRAYSCQSRHASLSLTFPCDGAEVEHLANIVQPYLEAGVMVNTDLSTWPVILGFG